MANNLFPHTLFEQNFKIQADLQGPLVIIFLFFYNYQTLALLTLATQGYILQNIRTGAAYQSYFYRYCSFLNSTE